MGLVEAALDFASQIISVLEKILATPKLTYEIPAALVVSCVLFALVAIPGAASVFGDFARELELEELDEMFDPIEPDRPVDRSVDINQSDPRKAQISCNRG